MHTTFLQGPCHIVTSDNRGGYNVFYDDRLGTSLTNTGMRFTHGECGDFLDFPDFETNLERAFFYTVYAFGAALNDRCIAIPIYHGMKFLDLSRQHSATIAHK